MISISFAYVTYMGELNVKGFNVTSIGDAMFQINDYIKYDIKNIKSYKCDASKALWGRDQNFDHILQVMFHDALNYHNEKI